MGSRDGRGLRLLLHTAPAGRPARLLTGVDTPTSRPWRFCLLGLPGSSRAQLQLRLLQEAFGTAQGKAAGSSDGTAPQMTRLLSLSRTT